MTFRPRPLFQAFYSAPLVLVVVFVYELLKAPTREAAVMLAAMIGVGLLTLPRAWARVTLAGDRLTLQVPFRRPRTVYLRQLIAVESTGRHWNTLILRYHPMNEQGQLDIASQEFLALVPLDRQSILEERLRAVVGPVDSSSA